MFCIAMHRRRCASFRHRNCTAPREKRPRFQVIRSEFSTRRSLISRPAPAAPPFFFICQTAIFYFTKSDLISFIFSCLHLILKGFFFCISFFAPRPMPSPRGTAARVLIPPPPPPKKEINLPCVHHQIQVADHLVINFTNIVTPIRN